MSNVMTRVRAQLPTVQPKHHRLRALLLAGALAVLLVGPLRGVLVLSMGVALGVVVAFALLGVVASVLLRRTARDLVAAQPHLLRLGHRFEITHDGVHVTSVERVRGGDVSLELSWLDRHQIELDADGLPLSVVNEGPGSCAWTLAGHLLPGDDELHVLRDLVGCELSLVEHGQVDPAGPRTTRRLLHASNGVVLDLHE